MSRWVVKRDGVYFCGLGSAYGRPAWSEDRSDAVVYGSRGFAANDAKRHGGRVVRLVPKRSKAVPKREDWKARAEKAEAEVERFKDEVARAYSTADEVWLRAMARSDHARRWKALAKELRRTSRACAENAADAWAELAKLRGPAPSDEEIGTATYLAYWGGRPLESWDEKPADIRTDWIRAGKAARALGGAEPVELTDEECDRLRNIYITEWNRQPWTKHGAIRAVLRAAGRYVEAKAEPKAPACTACGASRLIDDDGQPGACSFLPCRNPTKDWDAEQSSLPLRRREVGDEELGEIAYRAYLAANCVWAAAGRAAIALATRPAVPPTDGELAETYVFDVEIDESGRTQHVERLRAAWSLGGRSTITLEEFDAAAKAYWDSNPGRDGLRAALRSLGIEVES